jgi:Na+/melibiose symporter-like transporter
MLGAAGIATMVFYNQVLGVSAALCGVVFLVSSIVDAVSDPLVGSWSDNFRSRWGRRHPFMLFSALPLTVAFYGMYAPPNGLSEMQYFWWFMATMVVLRLGKTFYSVPHAALGAELTDDYHERTTIFGINTVTGMLAGALLGAAVLLAFFPSTEGFENGLLNPAGYPRMAVIGAAWVCLTLLVCVIGTRDQIPNLHATASARVDWRQYLRELGSLVGNRSYLSVCAAWLVMATSGGILGVVSTYNFIFTYELSTEMLTITRFITLPGVFVALPLSVLLTRWLDKKLTVIYSCMICATLIGLPHVLRMIGWFPENDSIWMMPMLFGSLLLGFLILPVVPIVIDSQLVDIADEHEYRTGRRAEGVVFSIRTFAIKATSGIGGLIAGFGLELIDFPENAKAENLTPSMLDGLLFMNGLLYWIIVAAGMLFMGMYRLNERRHGEIMSELEMRRAARVGGVSRG